MYIQPNLKIVSQILLEWRIIPHQIHRNLILRQGKMVFIFLAQQLVKFCCREKNPQIAKEIDLKQQNEEEFVLKLGDPRHFNLRLQHHRHRHLWFLSRLQDTLRPVIPLLVPEAYLCSIPECCPCRPSTLQPDKLPPFVRLWKKAETSNASPDFYGPFLWLIPTWRSWTTMSPSSGPEQSLHSTWEILEKCTKY